MKIRIENIRERIRNISPDKTEKSLMIRYRTDTDYEGSVIIQEKDLASMGEKEREKKILEIVKSDAKVAAGMIGKEYEV